MTKVFPQPKDLPIGSLPFARETIDRIQRGELTLESTKSELVAANKGLAASLQNLSEQIVTLQQTVNDLSSRYAVVSNGDFLVETGNLPNDATFHDYGSEMSLQITTPGMNKQIVVTWGASEFELWTDGAASSVLAEMTIAIDGVVNYNSYVARGTASGGIYIGLPGLSTRAFVLDAGTYTIRAKCRAWVSTGSGTGCWIIFHQPYLQAEIIGA